MYAAVFPITKIRKAEQFLISKNILLKSKKNIFLGLKVFFPIRDEGVREIKKIRGQIVRVPQNFFPERVLTRNLHELSKITNLPIPKSVTIIGDLVLINELPKNAEECKEEIGKILRENFSARAVFVKRKEITGILRIAQWERIAGFGLPITVHKESNFYYAVDLSGVFFNPRLSSERARIITQVKTNEVVIDMFAGVGPFSIPIAKKCARVYAIDINYNAIALMRLNIEINKVSHDKIIPIWGDAYKEVPRIGRVADRIIMNYPEGSLNFLESAIMGLKKSGGRLHVYLAIRALNKNKAIEKGEELIISKLKESNVAFKIIAKKVLREVAPRKYHIVFDVDINGLN